MRYCSNFTIEESLRLIQKHRCDTSVSLKITSVGKTSLERKGDWKPQPGEGGVKALSPEEQ